MHNPTAIIFGISVTVKVRNQKMLCFPTSPIWCFSITLQKRKLRSQCTGALCVQHSATAAALLTYFLLNHALQKPQAERILQDVGRHTAASIWVVSQKDWRNQLRDWLNSHNALIQWIKNAIFEFPVLPGSAQTQVTWGGIVKHFLTAYFIGSISAKKYQHPFTCVKVTARQRWDAFLEPRCICMYSFSALTLFMTRAPSL